MASVQILILRSGRSDAYGLPLTPGSIVTVDRDYAVSLVYSGFASWVNPADAYDGETNFRKPSETYTLYQSGIPWWIPPGDGGSNGLNFTGTSGVFTLSAAIHTSLWNMFASPGGGYMYLPAGAGGLASGGLYFFRMTSDTDGEVFQEKYSGTGQPTIPASPTAHPNLTSGRITQTTSEVSFASFILPGNSMGPNGIMLARQKHVCSNSANNKTLRTRVGGSVVYTPQVTTSYLNHVLLWSRQNVGVANRQIGNRQTGTAGNWDCGASATNYSADHTSVDTSIDQTVIFSGQLAANTDSIVFAPMQFSVQYGA